MGAGSTPQATFNGAGSATGVYSPRLRWDLAFLGILGYVIVEYSRLPAMFPVLIPLQLGKVVTFISLVGFLVSPGRSGRSGTRGVDIALGSFLFVCFVSTCLAKDQADAWKAMYIAFVFGVISFLVGRIVVSPWRVRVFLLVYFLLNFKLAQFAIRSYQAKRAWGDSPEMLSVRGVGAGSQGFFGNSGDFGVAMCVAFPLAGALVFAKTKKTTRFLLLVACAAYFAAIILCGSRGAVVGAAAASLVAFARNPRRIVGPVMAGVVLLGLLYFLPESSKDRMRSALHWEQDKTASLRISFWKAGLKMFRDHPVLGVGLGNFPSAYAESYAESGSDRGEWAPHNIFIQAASELGIAGLLPLLALLVLFLRLNARTRKHLLALDSSGHRRLEYWLAVGLDLALVGYLASGFFLTVLYYPHLWVLVGLSVGLHRAAHRIVPESVVAESQNRRGELALASA